MCPWGGGWETHFLHFKLWKTLKFAKKKHQTNQNVSRIFSDEFLPVYMSYSCIYACLIC